MSIATEIQRLQTAKENIKTAIEEKGVEVGEGLIDTYAEKIKEISSGGGIKYGSGTVEFAVNNTNITLYHNLGVKPSIVLIWTELTENTPVSTIGLTYQDVFAEPLCSLLEYRTLGETPVHTGSNAVSEINENYVTFRHRSAAYKFLTGVTYNWLVIE
jgi:hypothetical protein